MKAIIVDDEALSVSSLKHILISLSDISVVGEFVNPIEALCFAQKELFDLAFLDIEMPWINGLELAAKLRTINPDVWIVFTTGYTHYAIKAFEIKANGYLLKPYETKQIEKEIQHAQRYFSAKSKNRVYVQTFGEFAVFVDNELLKISSAKAKEFLALLIDRKGSPLTLDQIVDILWEGKDSEVAKGNFRVVVSRLQKILRAYKIEDIIIHFKNQYAVDPSKIDCDYYEFLSGNQEILSRYTGEYMAAYGWAETVNATIQNVAYQKYGVGT